MNNFQNFGDLDDAQIRLRLREMLLHRATIDRKDYALFDEEIDKEVAKDIEPDEDRDAFVANQTMGTGMQKVMACGMPTHMCMCDRGNGAKARKVMKSKLKKIAKKPKNEVVQEIINEKIIRKNLKPMGKKVKKGITEYNDLPNRQIPNRNLKESLIAQRKKKAKPQLVLVVNRRKSKRKQLEDEGAEEPYQGSDEDTEWMGSGEKPKKSLFRKILSFSKLVTLFR